MSKISVVLAAYNGSATILRQISSIMMQTRKPDEVIIIDDASNDDTVDIVRQFKEDNCLDNWMIIQNDHNVGWKENFKLGFSKATGDLIFPCDQDDFWYDKKIQIMTEIMDESPNIELLVSNYKICYKGTSPTENLAYLWNQLHMSNDRSLKQICFDEKWYYTSRPGCTYCFRSDLFSNTLKLWKKELSHDGQLWRYSCIRNSLYIYNEPLMDFWRYGSNSTSTKRMTRESRIAELETMLDFYKHCIHNLESIIGTGEKGKNKAANNIMKAGVEVISKRIELLERRKPTITDELKLYKKYKNYYMGIPAAIIDWKVGRE
ncbi:glycosyltransferase [Butyrivibrio fibrisolvens]|uniref:glycosyltransferase n=1 Tax=Butyrivibrio fibrisolvens TaxID=831 RepID=UPI0020BD7ABE|nr:glycosyltransferase [Butyrivibrio fibrisolvens]